MMDNLDRVNELDSSMTVMPLTIDMVAYLRKQNKKKKRIKNATEN